MRFDQPFERVRARSSLGIVKVRVAGVGSWLPAPSVAATANVWVPLAKPLTSSLSPPHSEGVASRRHAKAEAGSLAENPNTVYSLSSQPLGPEVMVVSGGVVSGSATCQEKVAGVGSVLPDASVAWTLNV